VRFAGIISVIVIASMATFAQVNVSQADSSFQKTIRNVSDKFDRIENVKVQKDTLNHSQGHSDSLKARITDKADSLRNIPSLYTNKLNAVQSKVSAKLDSLKSLSILPVKKMPEDSIGRKLQAIITESNEKVNGVANNIQNNTDSLGKRITGTTDKVRQGIGEKVTDITSEKVSIPDGKVPSVPAIKVPGIEGSAPSVGSDLPALNGQPLPDTKLSSVSAEIPTIEKIAQPALPKGSDKLKMPGEIDQLKQQTDKAGESFKEVQQYKDEMKTAKEQGLKDAEKLPEAAEEKVADLSEVKGAKKGMGAATAKQQEYEAMINRYKDKKLVQAEMKRKMTNVVNDQLNQQTPALKEAQASFSKSKKLYKDANSLSSAVKKKQTNAMEGKSFGQRLVPGITFQAYNRSVYTMDWGLQLGYRFTGRLTTGIGGTYRTGFSKSYDSFIKGLHVYGGRVYTDFLVRKGFFLHGEFEMLNTGDFITRTAEIPDASVWGSNVGIGKQYNLSKRIKGSIIALYRLEFNGHLPEQSKVNLRMGFDLKAKRKKNY
jgi:hypothetical protein